jgi:ribosomal protein S18 acetylase RimI-like enzyme
MKVIHRMKVFRQTTYSCEPLKRSDVEFAKVGESDIREKGQLPDDIFERQLERLRRFGASYCYGAYVDGNLAAFAWLIPHDLMPRDVPHLLRGKPGEAELTAGETAPRYRGRGLHGFVVINCFFAAREIGIDSVLFKTFPSNKAALRSFEKIGVQYIGTTYFLYPPGFDSPLVWPRQFR